MTLRAINSPWGLPVGQLVFEKAVPVVTRNSCGVEIVLEYIFTFTILPEYPEPDCVVEGADR